MKLFHNKLKVENLKEINKILLDGEIGFGNNVNIFENMFQKLSKKEYNVAVNSASAAAFIIFAYLKEKYGECDVYTSSLSFTSPAWAAKHFNHKIVWVDVDDNLLFDSKDYLAKRKTNSKKAILMPVLYGGISNINDWKVKGDEFILVDSAHCVTPKLKCDASIFSFHPYKPICSSDGGMISTDNKELKDYSISYRNFGRRLIDETYTIDHEGFKFYMNNLNATIAIESFKNYQKNLTTRIENYKKMRKELHDYCILDHDEHSSFYFATAIIPEKICKKIINNIKLSKHYPMLHKMKYYEKYHLELKKLEFLHPKILNIPLYDNLAMMEVIDEIKKNQRCA